MKFLFMGAKSPRKDMYYFGSLWFMVERNKLVFTKWWEYVLLQYKLPPWKEGKKNYFCNNRKSEKYLDLKMGKYQFYTLVTIIYLVIKHI